MQVKAAHMCMRILCTMYVAGNRNAVDVFDDTTVTKVPFGLTKYSDRFKSVEKVLEDNPQVKMIQGHSLGGAIALSLNEENGWKIGTRTYNAPIVHLNQLVKLEEIQEELEMLMT